jgi:hypothetical protein
MKLLKLYSWFAGSVSDFTNRFKDTETLYKQAKTFVEKLESNSMIIFLICIVLGISFAALYYKAYNDKPGRHYTFGHWVGFLFLTFAITFLATIGFEYFAVTPIINGAAWFECKIALCNAFYSLVFYFVTSWVWCQFNLPTNACRIFKI